jgi:hypothetical protein
MDPLSVPGIIDDSIYSIGGMIIYQNTAVVVEYV